MKKEETYNFVSGHNKENKLVVYGPYSHIIQCKITIGVMRVQKYTNIASHKLTTKELRNVVAKGLKCTMSCTN